MENIEISVWDKLSRKYDKLWVQKYSLTPSRNKIISIIKQKGVCLNLLDIGCATGQFLKEISVLYPQTKLIGIDKSIEMLQVAKEKNKNIDFKCVNAEDIEFTETFDIIICSHSFPYHKNKDKVMKNVSRLLKDDGIAIFVQASINNWYDKLVMTIVEETAEHAQYLSKKDFLTIANQYFDTEDIFLIKEKIFMPSICGFILRKKHDYITNPTKTT